jgi:hypothetical protein
MLVARDAYIRYLRMNPTLMPDVAFMNDFIEGYVRAATIIDDLGDPEHYLATKIDSSHGYRAGFEFALLDVS